MGVFLYKTKCLRVFHKWQYVKTDIAAFRYCKRCYQRKWEVRPPTQTGESDKPDSNGANNAVHKDRPQLLAWLPWPVGDFLRPCSAECANTAKPEGTKR